MRILIFLIAMLVPDLLLAAAHDPGIAGIAENLEDPIMVTMGFVGTASILIGACALFGAFLKYMQHRVNPLVAPISTIIVLVLIGIILIGLPFIYKLTGAGIPFHF